MRLKVVCETSGLRLPMDYRRKVVSMLKKGIQSVNQEKYEQLYEFPTLKEYTFSVYFGKANFQEGEIVLEENQIVINISTNQLELGMYLYNGLTNLKRKKLSWDTTQIMIQRVSVVPQVSIRTEKIRVRTLSPILCRNHEEEVNRDWFYTVEDSEFLSILKRNLTTSLVPILGEYIQYDIEEFDLVPIKSKKTVVQHYERKLACSIGQYQLVGQPHLLTYIVNSGLGSLCGSGFGFLEVM